MHYKLSCGIIVKTENAAKPETQGSKYLKSILANLTHVSTSFDYGCGKLRYVKTILQKTDTLAIVDSEVQISRFQKLRGTVTSIRNIIRGTNHIRVYNETEFRELDMKFQRGFCINVLSVIPVPAIRMKVLATIKSKLQRQGTCLFVVQYRNSDFTRMQSLSNTRLWRDGFLIDSLRNPSNPRQPFRCTPL